jgi:hypothetical protein
MPAVIGDAEKFQLNSDYPLDKASYLTSTSVALGSLSFNDVTFNHSLGFAPLLQSMWSQDSTFASAYDENSGPKNAGGQNVVQTAAQSTSTQITLFNTNNQAFNTTVYWRLFGFMPSNVNTDASFTNVGVDNYMLNSDYNYTKLYLSGVTAASATPSSTETVTHNLGYRPQVLCWTEKGGIFSWMNSFASVGQGNTCNVSTTDVTFTRDSLLAASLKFHYRIYLDE